MVIEEYNKDWIKQFKKIQNILENNLNNIVKIEHVGSTAIIGMCAKPIIDIDIVINNINDFVNVKKDLKIIGYAHKGDLGVNGMEMFERDNSYNEENLDNTNHHLYVCTKDNEELNRHILFRDYLNKNEKARIEYIEIKREIIKKVGNQNRQKYVSLKETKYNWFFEKIIKEAKRGIKKEL